MNKRKQGFTLAEILITLSIIGIVAAISIPSLLVNINDKTYDAQRNALLARMSQAVGQMDDISSYKRGDTTDESSAVAFITKGLSKVYKISSVCGKGHLDSCDIIDTIKLPDSTVDFKISDTENNTFKALNSNIGGNDFFDTDIAAFMTTNGESMLVYYNPNCKDKNENNTTNALSEVCVNMIYDLNGSKAPNTFGKDIGFMTIFHPSTPNVVAPVPYTSNISNKKSSGDTDSDASLACSTLNGDLILPDRESMLAMVLNKKLVGNLESTSSEGAAASSNTTFWTATVTKPGEDGTAWTISTDGSAKLETRKNPFSVRCIKK